jgi:hypothetical protein
MARARTIAWAAAVAIALVVPGVPGAARAQTHAARAKPLAQSLPADARRDYDAGKLLFEDGDYATALLKYQAAYDSTHDARLLWDVAVCDKSLRHYARALATLSRYLAEGGELLTAADRHDAQELSKAITPFTSAQTLHVAQDGAAVWIDEHSAGTSPLPGPVVLDIGTRRIRVHKDGFRVWDRPVPVGGSAATTVEIALEKEGGHLDLRLPEDATASIDGSDAGHGPTIGADLAVGPHALRVSAPKMRPIMTDVVIEDGKTRTLDLRLEPEAAPSSEVHVTVGCARDEPMPTDDLSVFFDDATESAPPLPVRMRREPGRDVIAYVPYRVSPGKHRVHVAALGCESKDAVIDAPDGGVATVTGALPPSDTWFNGSPAGSHDGWRLSVGVIESSVTFHDYENFFVKVPTPPAAPVGVPLVGGSVAAGFEGRWLTGLVDARFQAGHTGTVDSGTNGPNYSATLSQWSVGVRPGLRLPLFIASITAGVGGHVGEYFFSPSGGASRSGLFLSASAWVAVDVQPVCEWGLQVAMATSDDGYEQLYYNVNADPVTTFWVHGTFTPNSLCKRKQGGHFEIVGNGH